MKTIEQRSADVIEFFQVIEEEVASCGCCKESKSMPVMLGDVFKLMPTLEWGDLIDGEHPMNLAVENIINLWYQCEINGESAINKSLNEIFSGEIEELVGYKNGDMTKESFIASKFKDPNIQALLEFLETLIK